MKLASLLSEASVSEKKVAEDGGYELAAAMYSFATEEWNSKPELQQQYDSPSEYFKWMSRNERWRADFFGKFMNMVQQSFDRNIADIVKRAN